MGQYESIYNGSQIDDCVSQAVRTIVQQLTDAQKSQVRTNIGAGTYSIPSGGIPKTSLTTDVQTSLSKADNALPLSGGIMTGSNGEMIRMVTSANSSFISFYPNNQYKAAIGFDGSHAVFQAGTTGNYARIAIDNNGKPMWGYYDTSSQSVLYYYMLYNTISGASFSGDTSFVNIKTSSYKLIPHPQTDGLIVSTSGGSYLGEIAYYRDHFYIANYYNGVENSGVSFFNNGNTWISGSGNTGIGTDSPSYKLHVNGTFRANGKSSIGGTLSINAPEGNYEQGIRIHEGSDHWAVLVLCGSDNTGGSGTSSNTWGVFNNNGDFYINRNGASGANAYTLCNKSGNWGIATTSPSYKLHVVGTVGSTGFVNYSDVRKKEILYNVNIDIRHIADAPIFKYTWLDKRMGQDVNVGTSAQYWKMILPEIVSEANDSDKTLSMQYDVAGLVSSVILARKIVEQEETIKLQDTRIKELEKIVDDIQSKLDK